MYLLAHAIIYPFTYSVLFISLSTSFKFTVILIEIIIKTFQFLICWII